ncbi:MAG TPA: VCBS repeat-containing protein [Candidatus Acidoferrum sp.]|nr:VCBS repeat-containing protein [Candidatus Acidoferrum sp.]
MQFRTTEQPISRLVRTAVAMGSTQFAIADFDGDRQPDLAFVRVTTDGSPTSQYSVDFNFSTGQKHAIYIAGPSGGLQITPRDVNGDKFADLVFTSLLDSHFVAIFLNDGKGNFVAAKPSDFPDAAKGTDFRLSKPGVVPGGQAALLSRDNAAGDACASAGLYGPYVISKTTFAAGQIVIRAELAFPCADRAPPLV